MSDNEFDFDYEELNLDLFNQGDNNSDGENANTEGNSGSEVRGEESEDSSSAEPSDFLHSGEPSPEDVEPNLPDLGIPVNSAGNLSDADVERIFGEIVNYDYLDDLTLAEAARVIEAEHIAAEAEVQYNASVAEVKAIDEEVAELTRKLNELKRRESEIKSQHWDIRSTWREKLRNVEENKKAARQSYKNAMAQYEADLLSDKLERIARRQKWWQGIETPDGVMKVLPHQWDAMRFIAAGRRVLLGDEMGLGKTLSALGALDITELKKILIITPADITGNFLSEINFWTDGRPTINVRGQSKIARKAMIEAMSFVDKFCVVVNYEAWRKDHSLIEQLISVGFDAVICDEAHNLKEVTTSAYKGVREIIITPNLCPYDAAIISYEEMNCPICGWKKMSSVPKSDWKADNYDEAYWEVHTTKTIVMMTGSFILNKPLDLFAPLSLIDPINFNNQNEFLRQYATFDYNLGEKGSWVFGPGGFESLKKRLRGRLLSRTLADANIVLPPQKPIVHEVELDESYSKQAEIIEMINKQAEIILDENRQMSIVAQIALLTRLRQANVWPGGITFKEPNLLPDGMPNPKAGMVIWSVGEEIQESIKLDKAVELIREYVAQGQRMVVFSQFSTALHELQLRVDGITDVDGNVIRSVVFDGSTPQDLRTQIRTNFDKKMGEDKKWDVVLANYKTGGTGLNLTAATHTIILDQEWNPGKRDQALARTHRIGQTENTFVHIIEIPNTIDEWMNDIMESKEKMLSGFNEGVAQDLKEELLKRLRSRHNKGKK